MLIQLLRFESLYQIKQPSFIILLLASLGYGIAINADVLGQGMELLNINSSYRLSYFIALTSVLSIFVAMLFCVNSLLRDREYRFYGITGALAIKQRFISRAMAILLSTLCVISILSIGMMLGMLSPSLDEEKVTEFSLIRYLWPWLVFVLPNTMIITSLLVAVTVRKQSAFATYIATILLFILFWGAMVFIGAPITGSYVFKDPGVVRIFALLDPFGTSAFFEQSQFWTPTQKNQQLFSFSGTLLLNRMIWLFIASGIFFYIQKHIVRHSQLGKSLITNMTTKAHKQADLTGSAPTFVSDHLNQDIETPKVSAMISTKFSAMVSVKANTNTSTLKYQFKALLTLSSIEIKQLLSQWAFRVLMVLVTGMAVIGMLMAVGIFSSGEFSGSYPTTSLLISYSTEAFIPMVTALIIFYSAEKIWQEKLLKVDSLLDSTPVSNATVYGAKLLSLFFIPLFLVTLSIIVSVIFQIINGYYRFDLAHYISQFYFTALPVLIQTVLIFFIQTRIAGSRFENKYLGMVVSAIVIIFFTNSSGLFGIEHPLLNINQLPSLLRIDSDLVGYGDYAIKFHYLAAFWGVLALIIAGMTILSWNRGEWHKVKWFSGEKQLTTTRNKAGSKTARICLTVLIAVLVVIGGSIHRSIPTGNDYQTKQQSLGYQEDYERKYKQYQTLAIPQVSQMVIAVDFFPNRQSYIVKADHLIENTGSKAMHEIFVTARVPLQSIEIEKAKVILTDSTPDWSVYLFKLAQPLLPGHSLAMSYQLQQTSIAFAIKKEIVKNGSYLNQGHFEPLLGYVDVLEIKDKFERKNRGLAAKIILTIDGTKPSGNGKFITQKRTFEAVLSTSLGQTAVTSGQLVKTWQQGGRNFFHYKMQQPIYPRVGYFSAVYQTKSIMHQGIAVEMYFHPDHGHNIDEMLRATKATLDYATDNLGPYAFDSLRILEVPVYHPFGGKAAAGVVALSEKLYTEDFNDDAAINNTARNTIHEVMHQWWGEKLVPKITQGEGVLVESLTKYMEAVILENMYGKTMARHLTKYTQRRYFSGRAYASLPEVGLVDAHTEAYLNYGKGPVVLQALRELLGEQRLNAAFKQLIENHQYTLSATTDHLLAVLNDIAEEQHKPLIQDWLTKVIEYDLAINDAVINKLTDGRYEVVINVQALRLATGKGGEVREVGINEPIKIGLFSAHPDADSGAIIYLGNQQINQAQSIVRIIVEQKPAYVMIDPNFTRIDRDLANNITKIRPR
ncbi:MAG: hypothetical protein HRT37_18785 [Alteromonadaceae bacterium]|nr:hypothetical protein [Alteromonadaceae bacterium]